MGLSVGEAARQLDSSGLERRPVVQLQHAAAPSSPDELYASLLLAETGDQYLTYGLLETWLLSVPPTLDAQSMIPMPSSLQRKLLDMYVDCSANFHTDSAQS